MFLSNTESVPGARITRTLGLVNGNTVRAKHLGRDIMAGFRNLAGGELTAYTELLAESRNIEVLLRADEESHVVLGDENLLTTAIRNLVSNAVNYSPADTRISVVVTTDDDDVAVQVTDQGIGIPTGDLERIFERFYRVDSARSRQTGAGSPSSSTCAPTTVAASASGANRA